MTWGCEVESCRLCQAILRVVVSICGLTPHDHFLQLADIDIGPSDAIYLPDDVPEHLDFFFLGLHLLTKIVNHRLVLSTQLSQAHLADVERRSDLARVQCRVGCVRPLDCFFEQHLLLKAG